MTAEKKIIIADDETETVRTVSFILSGFGYSTICTDNGLKALDALQQCRESGDDVRLLITDINMPFMNGLELVEKVKAEYPLLPVIAITGFGDKNLVMDLLAKGCDGYIEKPFDDTELLKKIEMVMEKKAKDNYERILREAVNYRNDFSRLKEQVDTAEVVYANIIKVNLETLNVPLVYQSQPLSNMGGDLLCAHNSKNGSLFLITDVSGHDMGASFHNVIIKATFSEYVDLLEPEMFMRKLNKALVSVSDESRIVTGMFLCVDSSTSLLTIVNAGHPPCIRYSSTDKKAEYLKTSGNIMGIYESPEFDCMQVPLRESDRYFFYTDGTSSVSRIDGVSGVKEKLHAGRLLEYAEKYADCELDKQIEKIWSELTAFCRYKYDDDMLLAGLEIPRRPYVQG